MIESWSAILQNTDKAGFIERIITSSLLAIDPQNAVRKLLKIYPSSLQVGDHQIAQDSNTRIRIAAIGKAGLKMASGAFDALGKRIFDGIVITKMIPDQSTICFPAEIKVMIGGHPLPTEDSILCGQELLQFLRRGKANDLILALVSGGGSALVQLPVDGVSLRDLKITTLSLQRCGATIEELNIVRKHLDLLKGGGFLRLAEPARVASLLVSDVMDDRLGTIASGMTVADISTSFDALDVLERYHLIPETPVSIANALRKGAKVQNQEIHQQEDLRLQPPNNSVILNNATAVEGAMIAARQAGWNVENLGWILEGEAENAGKKLAELLSMAAADSMWTRPICLVGGGETTVQVNGEGIGGRNLEVALGAVAGLVGLTNVALITLATDGEDGQTGVAGAVVTERTQRIADRLGLSAQNFLDENNSFRFFEAVGGLIRTGSTGTNVNDLVILLAW